MNERYREDYLGEYVITKIIIKNGNKKQIREWIDNPLTIKQTSNRATCISESHTIKDTFYKQIQNSNGGNLGKLKMQVYGVDSICNKMTADFIICKDQKLLEYMIKTGYTQKSIAYTSASNCIKYPGEFYLIPYNMSMNTHALAVWLACFDGHKEIFIVGYDHSNEKINNTVSQVMKIYNNVKFRQISNSGSPHEWKQLRNFATLTKQEYISLTDI